MTRQSLDYTVTNNMSVKIYVNQFTTTHLWSKNYHSFWSICFHVTLKRQTRILNTGFIWTFKTWYWEKRLAWLWRLRLNEVYIESLLKWRTGNPKMWFWKPPKSLKNRTTRQISFSHSIDYNKRTVVNNVVLHYTMSSISFRDTPRELKFSNSPNTEWNAILNGTSLYAWILHHLLSNQLRNQQTYKLYINTVSAKSILGDRVQHRIK